MTASQKLLLHSLRAPLVLAVVAGGIACAFRSPDVRPIDLRQPPTVVRSPVKAHLVDGSTVLYPNGVQISNTALVSVGQRFALGSSVPTQAGTIPLDSVVGIEAYETKYNVAGSVAATSGAIVLGTVGAAGLAIAIFGSCPTFYADSAGTQVLQAEGFSYSIAPLFEQRDVDRLHGLSVVGDNVLLHVRNEALETHYINHLELIEVQHTSAEMAMPDQGGRPIAVTGLTSPVSLHDRAGRDLRTALNAIDGNVFSTAEETLRGVSATDFYDHIDLTIPAAPGTDSVALVLDMRNSLLNTVLLYDQILAAPGGKSLDWLGKDLDHIGNAIEMGRWYATRMGMRISVRENDIYRQVARIGDSGPIAFHDLTVLVPASRADDGAVHVRLSFVADDWRIDAIRAATSWRRPKLRRVPATTVAMYDSAQNTRALTAIHDVDESYLITTPGQSFTVSFAVGGESLGPRTFLLASQGYYTEWVRGDWIKNASGKPFVPSDESLVEAIRSWRSKQTEMERHFYSTRISAR